MTNIFMKGDLDDMIFEGSDWQPSCLLYTSPSPRD